MQGKAERTMCNETGEVMDVRSTQNGKMRQTNLVKCCFVDKKEEDIEDIEAGWGLWAQ